MTTPSMEELETIKKATKLQFSDIAIRIVAERYLMRSLDGSRIETPEEMFHRVATSLATVEQRYGRTLGQICELEKEFYDCMSKFEFCPAGRTLNLAGNPSRSLVCNCVVLHMDDSLDSIFETLAEAATLQQAGSGIGFPFGKLRPVGSHTKRTGGTSSGPVSFMHIFNSAFGVIKLSGRHGANMSVMPIDHPDILEFIDCKAVEGALRNFNISVTLTDEFMDKVVKNDPSPWFCEWKGKKLKPNMIVRDDNFNIIHAVDPIDITAPELFDRLVSASHRNGEPGCIFIDTVNKQNPLPKIGPILACNPCGEQYLHDGEACNLGSINLAMFVKEDRTIDYDGLTRVVTTAVRILDNVIDVANFPVKRVQDRLLQNRRIGLGIMGFADMLVLLRKGYKSQEGRDVAEQVMKHINDTAHDVSRKLAAEKGVFPSYKDSIYFEKDDKHRNLTLTNCPPTGTTSLLFDVNGGVEPFFKLAYLRRNSYGQGTDFVNINKYLKKEMEDLGIDMSMESGLMKKIIAEGSIQNTDLPQELKDIYVTAVDMTHRDHLLMQASLQKHCDNAISKTINFPGNATVEDIKQCYIDAWRMGCKGVTVYRDGSRNVQVLSSLKKKDVDVKDETIDSAEVAKEEKDDASGKVCQYMDDSGGYCEKCDM